MVDEPGPATTPSPPPINHNKVEKENKILALLEEPLNVDAIKARIGLETGTIIASLSLLELKGLVRNLGGDMYQKI